MDASVPYAGQQANKMNAVALPFFALLAILVTYLPCRSFWSHRNVPAVSIVVATNVYNAMSVVNGVMWPNDDWASWWPGYGLCDLEALLRYPITMALATSLCGLSKGLADCLDTNNATVHPTAASKRRELLFNVMFCWAIPVLQMALHYVIQNGRYQIFPVFGCSDVIDDSWPTILIIMIWCPIFTFSTLYYAVILLIRLRKHRRTISSALKTSGSGFAARKYLKLVIITMSLIVIYVPVQFVFFFQVLPRKLEPYSWSRIHDPATWHLIEYQHTGDAPLIQYQGWAGIVTSFLIWAYFGFNDTAVDTYRSWLVQLGLGRIWPSLKLSRETRMMMRRSQGSSIARGSIDSHFDLVGKAMKYFDTDIRQESGATTLVDRHSNRTASRKGSQGTLAGLTRAHTDSSSVPSSYLSDTITPAPPAFAYPVYPMQPLDHPEPTPAPSSPRNLFSSFRTHLNVPIPLFGSRSAPSQAHTGKQTQLYDLEAQRFDIPRRGSGVIIPTVKTSIRSGPAPFVLPHATSVPAAIHEEEDEDIDPLAPKMGTRAYREREKREMQRRKDEEKVAKVIADDVKVEMGGGSVGKGKEFASVIKIVKSFDLSEESKAGRS